MKKHVILPLTGVLTLALVLFACQKEHPTLKNTPDPGKPLSQNLIAGSNTSKGKGPDSIVGVYYDSAIVNIHFVEFSPNAEANLLAHNKSINKIYQSDPGLPGNLPFVYVIDAVPGDGFNPVWQEVQITFNPGFTPRQLYSDNEILAAASGNNPMITLSPTTEVYWCPVVGHK